MAIHLPHFCKWKKSTFLSQMTHAPDDYFVRKCNFRQARLDLLAGYFLYKHELCPGLPNDAGGLRAHLHVF